MRLPGSHALEANCLRRLYLDAWRTLRSVTLFGGCRALDTQCVLKVSSASRHLRLVGLVVGTLGLRVAQSRPRLHILGAKVGMSNCTRSLRVGL